MAVKITIMSPVLAGSALPGSAGSAGVTGSAGRLSAVQTTVRPEPAAFS